MRIKLFPPFHFLPFTLLSRGKLIVVHPVSPGMRFDQVVSHGVHVCADGLVVCCPRWKVSLPVPTHGDDPGLVESSPHLDLVTELTEAYPGILLKPRDALRVEPASLNDLLRGEIQKL